MADSEIWVRMSAANCGPHLKTGTSMKTRFALALCLISLGAKAFADVDQPNIIIYMVDDLGWNHIGVDQVTMGTHEKQYVTPHLARLADEGLSFTHAYAQPNCAPTRAAMLSGQYPARIHNNVYVVGNLNRNGKGGISKQTGEIPRPATKRRRRGRSNHDRRGHERRTATPPLTSENTTSVVTRTKRPCRRTSVSTSTSAASRRGINRAVLLRSQRATGNSKVSGWDTSIASAMPYSEDYIKRRALPAELIGTSKHISDAVGDALEETVGKLHATGKPFLPAVSYLRRSRTGEGKARSEEGVSIARARSRPNTWDSSQALTRT